MCLCFCCINNGISCGNINIYFLQVKSFGVKGEEGEREREIKKQEVKQMERKREEGWWKEILVEVTESLLFTRYCLKRVVSQSKTHFPSIEERMNSETDGAGDEILHKFILSLCNAVVICFLGGKILP